MNNMERFETVIEYIEEHLEEKIDVSVLAKLLNVSMYEFRRVFSFIAGVPVSDYIRKRRLSVAASELAVKKYSVTGAAIKWGYDSPSSFSRAFKEFHGCSPNETERFPVKMFTKLSVFSSISGGKDFSYKIMKKPAFSVYGVRGISDETDTECCENVWQKFYAEENGLLEQADGNIYAVYQNNNDYVDCIIGIAGKDLPGREYVNIPESLWACFKVKGSEDSLVNCIYSGILNEWAKSGNLMLRKDLPNVEIFPVDMESDDFEWEILIPVEEKRD